MDFFNNLGEDGDESNDHIKLNFLEKTAVFAISTYVIALAKKARRAKTYGDVRKILEKLEATINKYDDSDELTEEGLNKMIKDLEDQTTVVTHLDQ